jgi:hypothetical protein
MESFCHWLTELAEVYIRHAGRHGPHRLLPAEVLPTEVLPAHGRAPGHRGPSPQCPGPDGRTVEHSTPATCACRAPT